MNCAAPSGQNMCVTPTQGCGEYALPWAILLRPVGAKMRVFFL
ncbi:MAG: hypothetical protein ACRC10_04605 [Thermoguttaceae bacterium]